MPNFTGQLTQNEIFSTLFNMIISMQVFTDNIRSDSSALVTKAKVDGSMYGDTKLYIATDVLGSTPWGADAEAVNLLDLDRPVPPDVQAIKIDTFRQIRVTTDQYMSKRAFADEGTFIQFNSAILGWLSDTKRVYDKKLYNAYIGTTKTTVGEQYKTVTLADPSSETGGANVNQAYNLRALQISKEIEDIFDELDDANREYNDYGNLREVSKESCTIVMNSNYANEFRLVDIPAIFHNEKIIPEVKKLQSKFFGDVNTTGANAPTPNTNVRSLIEVDFNTVKRDNPAYDKSKHIFPGDLWPSGVAYGAYDTYTENPKIICKIIGKLPPYMSAFEVETIFFNPRALNENHYLTFGHNTIEYLKNYPLITIEEN